MSIRNLDLDTDKVFVNIKTGQIARQRDLKHQLLNENIYYSPSSSPLVSVNNTELGSCYQDWIIPSASIIIDTNQLLTQHLTLEEYQNFIGNKIQDTIAEIYKKHSRVYLAYSGGIDSQVILSAVINLNLISRTTLVVFENHSQSSDDCLHQDLDRKRLVDEVCQHVKNLGAEIEYQIISIDDLISAANQGLAELKCYATYALLTRNPGRAWMFGYHGNQLLLHKSVYFDEILYRCPEKKTQIESVIAKDIFYTKNLKSYQIDKKLTPLHQCHLMLKPWHLLDGINGCRIYSPIGPDNHTFDQCRSIDFQQVHPGVIADADVARWLIDYYNQNWLNSFITTESMSDMDTLKPVEIPIDHINTDVLTLPTNLCHHPKGAEWILNEIEKAKTKRQIPINTLVSLKNLSWLANI